MLTYRDLLEMLIPMSDEDLNKPAIACHPSASNRVVNFKRIKGLEKFALTGEIEEYDSPVLVFGYTSLDNKDKMK